MTLALQLAAAATAQPVDDTINPDRPGLADGSNVVGAGRVQVETGLQFRVESNTYTRVTSRHPGGGKRAPGHGPQGRPLTDKVEFRVESNTYTRVTQTDPTQGRVKTEGVAPAAVGLKVHFIDADGSQRPSVGAIVRFFPRSGSSNFGTTRATGDFRLAADWDFLPEWSLNPNVGVGLYEGEARRLYTAGLFAATLSYNPSKSLNFFVDTGVQTPETRHGRTAVLVDVGMAWLIGRDLQFDFSAGSRVAGETPPRTFLAAGISQRF